MQKVVCILVALLAPSLGMTAGTAQAVAPQSASLALNSPDDLEIFFRLDHAVKDVSEKMIACTKTGKTAEICRCENKTPIEQLDRLFKDSLKQRPHWKNRDLTAKGKDDLTVFLSLSGLEKELQTKACH